MNEELGGVKPEASLDVLNSGACVMYVISVIFSVTILIVKATPSRYRQRLVHQSLNSCSLVCIPGEVVTKAYVLSQRHLTVLRPVAI